jgi:hypothetical protein
MKSLFALLLMTTSAHSQSVNNNATVNLQGANQNVSITQLGAGHSATVTLSGDGVSAIISQRGNFQSFSLSVSCGSNCPSSPYVVNQY